MRKETDRMHEIALQMAKEVLKTTNEQIKSLKAAREEIISNPKSTPWAKQFAKDLDPQQLGDDLENLWDNIK